MNRSYIRIRATAALVRRAARRTMRDSAGLAPSALEMSRAVCGVRCASHTGLAIDWIDNWTGARLPCVRFHLHITHLVIPGRLAGWLALVCAEEIKGSTKAER